MGAGRGGSHLVAYDAVVGQTQVGERVVSELEGTLVQLRHRLVHVQDGELLVDLTDHLEPDETGNVFTSSNLIDSDETVLMTGSLTGNV